MKMASDETGNSHTNPYSLLSTERRAIDFETVLLCVYITKAFGSIHHGKWKKILLTNSIPEETTVAVMMFTR